MTSRLNRERFTLRATTAGAAAGIFLALCAAGCRQRPNAPALLNEPVYLNKQEGFRFRAPEGWTMRGRGEFPPDQVTAERLLVEYRRPSTGWSASFKVSMNDTDPSRPLADYLEQGRVFRKNDWRRAGPVEEIDLGGKPAVRAAYTLRRGKAEATLEVVAVRRGGRVYYFTGIFPSSDTRAREDIRQALASLSWEKGF